jgi:Cupin-like domain
MTDKVNAADPFHRTKCESLLVLQANPEALEAFSDNVSSLWLSSSSSGSAIPRIDHDLSVLEFYREFVARSRPCILSRNTDLARPLPRWTVDDVQDLCCRSPPGHDGEGNHHPEQHFITVNVTPDGHGDAIRTVVNRIQVHDQDEGLQPSEPVTEEVFLVPEQRRMAMDDFVTALRQTTLHPKPVDSNTCGPPTLDANGLPILYCCTASDATQSKNCNSESTTASTDTLILVQPQQPGANDNATPTSTPSNQDSVYYYSLQNDCLRSEFATRLLPSLEVAAAPLLAWAQDVFGTGPPEATNLWMGNEGAHSSLHRDPYENLFHVASGEKIFTLYPPSHAAFLPVPTLNTKRFDFQTNAGPTNAGTITTQATSNHHDHDDSSSHDCGWQIIQEYNDHEDGIVPSPDLTVVTSITTTRRKTTTPWIHRAHAPSHYLHPITVRVQAGDILYIPSLWFHEVTQSTETVGLNWWFDMQFQSPLYCYFQLLESCELKIVDLGDDDDGDNGDDNVRDVV